jgi:hypothetical protein
MKHIILSLFIVVLSCLPAWAQHDNVLIGPSLGWGFPGEPAVCMNPANPSDIMVAAMPDFYYSSVNGGLSWTTANVQSIWGVNADPVLLVDEQGRYYYLHLPDTIERVVCHRADNITSPFTLETSAAFNGTHDVDKEWASYDPVNDRIFLSWTYFDTWGSNDPDDSTCIYMSRSDDFGQSWSDPVRVSDTKGNAQGGNYSVHGSYNTTGPNGEVYIAWWAPQGLMFDRSPDGGNTWLPEDVNITNAHVNWIYTIPGVNLAVTFPVIACDRSGGPDNGNIYICWADKRNGSSNTDVFIVKSSDGGLTWSDPIKVNDDPPGRHQFFPFITVDQVTGKVWLVFYDRRNYADNSTDVYMAVSNDGGDTFTNFRVSETPFIPYNTVFYGHYIGVAAYNDHVFPVWMRMDDGNTTIMGALVDVTLIGEEDYPMQPFSVVQSSPNPFNESSFLSFRLRSPTRVTIRIFDCTGKCMATQVDNKLYAAGKHVERVDAKALGLKPGVYLVHLSLGNENYVRRILFVGNAVN